MKRREVEVEVKEAIATARRYLSDVFAGEDVSDVRLEEVVYDRDGAAWLITFGLMRPSASVSSVFSPPPVKRTYKVVSVPEGAEERPSIRIRELAHE